MKSENTFLNFVFKYFGRYSILVLAVFFGLLIGVFLLLPINEIVYYYELHMHLQNITLSQYILNLLYRISCGEFTVKTVFFGSVGGVLGVVASFFYSTLHKRTLKIRSLSGELEKSFPVMISQGESAILEFKSSFRWDLKDQKLNRMLENVVIKTIAGFMNADGGTLLVGVADDGTILGLQDDYQTLKKKDRDGFEQAVMNAISVKLGTNVCRQVMMVFHSMEGKDICRIIAMPTHKPVFVKDGAKPKLYLRTGVSTRELNIEEAVDYISIHWSEKKRRRMFCLGL